MEYNYESLMKLGRTIATERKRRRWTQYQLITELSTMGIAISRNRLSAIEQGKDATIDAKFLFAICELFAVDMGHLFGDYEEKTKTLHEICAYTGLSEKTIETLHQLAALPNKPGLRGVQLPGYKEYIEELSLLDDLITSKHLLQFLSNIAEYLIYAGALPGHIHPKRIKELSLEEYEKFLNWANSKGLVIEDKKKICDMFLQNACDILKQIYREVLERDGKGW